MQLKHIFVLASVFVTGAAVLVVEIVAMRMLSPHYGNTLYSTSSVISIILAALSLGYVTGGRLADKWPNYRLFYTIIFSSGVSVVLLQAFSLVLLPVLGITLSLVLGPLVASLTLFFFPALLLGTLSPFAIKLLSSDTAGIGGNSGNVFFWSTAGSITGSLTAGFFLIPSFGVSRIMIGTGIAVVVLGAAGLLLGRPSARFLGAMACTALAAGGALVLAHQAGVFLAAEVKKATPYIQKTIYEKDGVYEKITIAEGEWNGSPVRFLFQDRSFSAAMRLDSPELAYEYTKYYKLYTLFKPKAKAALVIGGGAYSVPKALLQDSQDITVDVAEIEPDLYLLAKQYFNLQENSRLANHIEDGRQFLARSQKTYDVIFSDVYYSLFSVPMHFTTREFFHLAKNRLTDNGVVIGNLAGDLQSGNPSFIRSEMATFRSVFPNSYFFAVQSPSLQKPQNIIFVGVNGSKNIDFAAAAESRDPIFTRLAQKLINIQELDLADATLLTDDYAPVEYLIGKLIKAWN